MSIFTYQNLYKSYLECRQSKRKTISALEFELNLEENLFNLLNDLRSGEYAPGRSICFAVTEPKPREIFAAGFRDRIVHHLLVRELLKMSEKSFFFYSFACRRCKGTHKAVCALKKYIRQVSRNKTQPAYYLQMDISNFFSSINHQTLYEILKKFATKQKRDNIWQNEILWLGKKIIFHRPQDNCHIKGSRRIWSHIPKHKSLFYAQPGVGLPIGNYSSQFFANLYLNELDYFVKQRLRQKYYLRYVDDFIILGKGRAELSEIPRKIDTFLGGCLALGINFKKTKLKSLKQGVDFLGYIIKLDYTLVRRRSVNVCKNKIYKQLAGFNKNNGKVLGKKFIAQVNSYLGHFRHADSFFLRKHLIIDHLRVAGRFIYNRNYKSININF